MSKLTITFMLLLTAYAANAGTATPNGGQMCAAEFKSIARDVLERVEKNARLSKMVPMGEFRNRIATADVHSTSEKVMQNGIELDAFNDPESNSIQVYQRWCDRPATDQFKIQIVFHEYLGLTKLGIDEGYVVSELLSDHKIEGVYLIEQDLGRDSETSLQRIKIEKLGNDFVLTSGSGETLVLSLQPDGSLKGSDYWVHYLATVHPSAGKVCVRNGSTAPCNATYTDTYHRSCKIGGGSVRVARTDDGLDLTASLPLVYDYADYNSGNPCDVLISKKRRAQVLMKLKKKETE